VRRRFFVQKFEAGRAVMEGEAAHHLGRVLRAERGQLFELSDGLSAWLGRIESVGRERIEFGLIEELPTHVCPLKTSLLLALVKFDAFEWALEKATELGVSVVVPLGAERTDRALIEAAPKRAERWKRILTSASEQSRRLDIPALGALVRPEKAFENARAEINVILSERPGTAPLRSILNGLRAKSAALAIGPEGGWTDAEIEAAGRHGFREASLGNLILRTETAVIAALASVNYAFAEIE
jgi:16S rRNA (uracil1498-N3)-methyltransferase